MRRFSTRILTFLLPCLAFGALANTLPFMSDPVLDQVAAQTPPHAPQHQQPSVTCPYTPLTLILTGSGNVEDIRPFSTTGGESFFQFAPAEPITTSNFSGGAALLNHSLSGSVSGDMSGSFSISNLNGLAITGSTTNPNARGFEANSVVVTDSQGSLTLLLTYNFSSSTATPPYYPRTINGNFQSTSGTGVYSQPKFAGTIIGTIGAPSGGIVPIDASMRGRLYTVPPNAPMNRHSNPSRDLPAIHAFSLSPSDTIAQFYRPDIHPTSSVGSFTPNSVFSGPLYGGSSIVGTTSIDNAQLVAGTQLDFSPGWAVGNWRMYESQGNAFGPFLADQNGPFPNGYFFQVGGDGSYTGGLMFSPMYVTIGYQGGTDMTADPVGGYYCTAFAPTQPLLVGHVNWEARPSQPSQLQALPITLTLKSTTTEVNYPLQTTDQYGFFTLTLGSLPNDTYAWRADDAASVQHSPNYLANSGTVDYSSAPTTNIEIGLMRAGDVNNDNRVSATDFSLLKTSFGFTCGDPLYDNRADFTGDCTVNVSDFNPLKRNFGQAGSPPISPGLQ